MKNNSFYIKALKGQFVNTEMKLSIKDTAATHGVILDNAGAAISGALVVLFEIQEEMHHPVAYIETDKEGHFAFSSLEAGKLYRLRVFVSQKNMRNLVLE